MGVAVSWQATTYLVLGALLVVVFAWYELRRPSSKTVALVATLAALAVVGRLAFAALPNVQATTDIVFFAGFVFGGVPGAVVGALGALASNVFFGQGPWTPWQMLAWGLVGVYGAGIAAVFGRRSGRAILAICCAVAGLGFGLVMNFSLWVTFAGTNTPESFLALEASALWFDIAHMTGNFLLALAAGPTIVRALERYRRRFEVSWGPSPAGGTAVGTLLALFAVAALTQYGAMAAEARASVVDDGVAYLREAQNSDGGFGPDKGQRSSQLMTGWTALGIAAAGESPGSFESSGNSVVAYIRSHLSELDGVGDLERTMLALRAAGLSPRRFAGRNLYRELVREQRRDGSFSRQIGWTSFGVLALRAASVSRRSKKVRRASKWLARKQNGDGGFPSAEGGSSDVDMTGATLQAFVAAGARSTNRVRWGARFLLRARNPDGGYGQMRGADSNGQSTAWAIQGLVAAGRSVKRPLGYLRSLQQRDGSFRYSRVSRQTPVWVTAQALPALRRKPFPLNPVRRPKATSTAKTPIPAALAAAAVFALLFSGAKRRIVNRRRF